MAFSDDVFSLDSTVLSTFAPSNAPTLAVHPKDGGADVVLTAVPKNPGFEEDYQPGTDQNVSVLYVFVHPVTGTRLTVHGDTATYGTADYDVIQVDVDREGGQTIKMRRRGQRFDQ